MSLDELLLNVRMADFLDVGLVALAIYCFTTWVRKRRGMGVAVTVVALAILYATASLFGMYLTLTLFRVGLTIIIVSLVIVFQQDIRQAIESLAAYPLFSNDTESPSSSATDALVGAVEMLANQRFGALIVLRGAQSIERHLQGGVPANAELTVPLLHSIFDKHSQGHDGAVVIKDNTVEQFGVHLPMSSNLTEVGMRGTRHTAALGLAERCDAMVVVVSEETGAISIAEQNTLEAVDSPAELKRRLLQFLSSEKNADSSASGFRIWKDVGWKATSLVLASVLWFAFAFEIETVHRTFADVPVELRDLPESWKVEQIEPQTVDLTLSGPERAFDEIDEDKLAVVIRAADLNQGLTELRVEDRHLKLPPSVSVDQSDHSQLRIRAQQYRPAKLPVMITTSGTLTDDLQLVELSCDPAEIEVAVPANGSEIQNLATKPVDLSAVTGSIQQEVGLYYPEGVIGANANQRVKVSLTVRHRDEPTVREED